MLRRKACMLRHWFLSSVWLCRSFLQNHTKVSYSKRTHSIVREHILCVTLQKLFAKSHERIICCGTDYALLKTKLQCVWAAAAASSKRSFVEWGEGDERESEREREKERESCENAWHERISEKRFLSRLCRRNVSGTVFCEFAKVPNICSYTDNADM